MIEISEAPENTFSYIQHTLFSKIQLLEIWIGFPFPSQSTYEQVYTVRAVSDGDRRE